VFIENIPALARRYLQPERCSENFYNMHPANAGVIRIKTDFIKVDQKYGLRPAACFKNQVCSVRWPG
jgi:hypothetical protein